MTRDEKLSEARRLASVAGVAREDGWTEVSPDEHHNWLSKMDPAFDGFLPIGDKKGGGRLFEAHSHGVSTNRDAWVYNYSRASLERNVRRLLATYNADRRRLAKARVPARIAITDDPNSIKWTTGLRNALSEGRTLRFTDGVVVKTQYRPFTKVGLSSMDPEAEKTGGYQPRCSLGDQRQAVVPSLWAC